MKKYILILMLLFPLLLQSQTKTNKNLNEVKANTKNIANEFINKNYAKLFNSLKPYWGIETSEIDSLIVKTQSFKTILMKGWEKQLMQ